MKLAPSIKDTRPLIDCVEEASMDSFPCSDPPAWTGVIAHTPCDDEFANAPKTVAQTGAAA